MVNDDVMGELLRDFDRWVRESAAMAILSDSDADAVSRAMANHDDARLPALVDHVARAVGGADLAQQTASGYDSLLAATRRALDGPDFETVAVRFIALVLADQQPGGQ